MNNYIKFTNFCQIQMHMDITNQYVVIMSLCTTNYNSFKFRGIDCWQKKHLLFGQT